MSADVRCFHCRRPGTYGSHGHSNPWPDDGNPPPAPSGYYDPGTLAATTPWHEQSVDELVPGCLHGPIECQPCWNARTRTRDRHEQPSGGPPPFSKPEQGLGDDDGWWSVLDEVQS